MIPSSDELPSASTGETPVEAASSQPTPPSDPRLPVGSREELAAGRLQLLTQARRRIDIHQPQLGLDAYNSEAELTELRRIATAGRGAQIRLLIHDAEAALRSGHRLVLLAQRLSSTVLVRIPVEDTDLAHASACLLDDQGGYLFQPDELRPVGRASPRDRAAQVPLQQYFDEVWSRSVPARAWQKLDL